MIITVYDYSILCLLIYLTEKFCEYEARFT